MRDLAVLAFVTLDGVMQAPGTPDEDRSGGFDQGGWATPFWEGVMAHVLQTAMAQPYDILLGRKTYDNFAGHWPDAPPSGASDRLNSARKYVATHDQEGLLWNNTQALEGDAVDAVRELKAQDGLLLQVHGSTQLIQTLLAHDLIDEFRLWTFPVMVGRGKRLFDGEHPPMALQTVAAEALENGVTAHVCRRVGTA